MTSKLPERSKKFVHRMGARQKLTHKLHGRPFRCKTCKLHLEYDTDMKGEAVELVSIKGVRYLHECA